MGGEGEAEENMPPTPAVAQPTPLPPTPVPAQPTPSPSTPTVFRTALTEAVNAGDKVIRVEDVEGFAAGMSLTITGNAKTETKTIVAVIEGAGRRLAAGSVTLDTALENSYAAAALVTAVLQQNQTTISPVTPTTTAAGLELMDAA